MIIVRHKETQEVKFSLDDDAVVELTQYGLSGTLRVLDVTSDEYEVVENVPSTDIVVLRSGKHEQIAAIAKSKMDGGVVLNGLQLSTSSGARSLLALGRLGGKQQRKVVVESGQRITLTLAEFEAVVAAIDDFGQSVMDRHYDLCESVDNAGSAGELNAIDINVGWP